MRNTSSHFSISYFRNRVAVWLFLAIFISSFAPSASLAQQPTAKIKAWTGSVLVSGQAVTVGMELHAGDTLQTGSQALAILELSDGSTLHLGANTQINIADLAQTATGGRVSLIKLLAGRVRALLSANHQKPGSAFTIETPNAQIGVKFSQPDVEVSYDPAKQETVGIAHTVELIAINLLTNEKIIVPVGSTVIIIGALVKIAAGTAASMIAREAGQAAATTATGTTSAATAGGIGKGTMIAIGAGAVAAAGGVAAIAASSGGKGDGNGGEPEPEPAPGSIPAECSQVHTSTNVIASVGSTHWFVRSGRAYWVQMVYGFPTEAEARAIQPYISFSLSMNGVPLSMNGNSIAEYQPGNGWWEVNAYFCSGILAPGDYTFVGNAHRSDIGYTFTDHCFVTAQ